MLTALAALIFTAGASAAGATKDARKAAGSVKVQMRGVVLSPNWNIGAHAQDQSQQLAEIDKACDLGSDLVRFHISWPSAEPTGPGLVDNAYFARVDAALARARACGIKVLVELIGTPCWATVPVGQKASCTGWWPSKPSAQPGQMQRFSSYLLNRYADLYALEVWNEPNLSFYWSGTPADYVAMVKEVDAARDATGSRVKIIAAALAGTDVAYLEALYAAGLSGHDGISLHPYSFAGAGEQTYFANPGRQGGNPKRLVSSYFRGVEAIRRSMVRHGEARKGMWFTEFGFATCPATPACGSEQVQANWLAKSFRIAAENWPFVHGLMSFTLRDLRTYAEPTWDYHFGLLNHDFTPKLAFGVLKRTFKQLRRTELHAPATKPKAKRKI